LAKKPHKIKLVAIIAISLISLTDEKKVVLACQHYQLTLKAVSACGVKATAIFL